MTTREAFFVSRTLQALEVLAFQPSSAPQLGGRAAGPPAHRAAAAEPAASADGWATRSEGARRIYAPTMRIVALAAQLAERDPLALARGAGRRGRLHDETGAVAHLAIPSYRSALCLVHEPGGPDARPQLRELVPAHATAAGKVLLAFRDDWRESVLAGALEPADRAHDHGARRSCRRRPQAIRGARHALEDEEFLPGVRGVAVPGAWRGRRGAPRRSRCPVPRTTSTTRS